MSIGTTFKQACGPLCSGDDDSNSILIALIKQACGPLCRDDNSAMSVEYTLLKATFCNKIKSDGYKFWISIFSLRFFTLSYTLCTFRYTSISVTYFTHALGAVLCMPQSAADMSVEGSPPRNVSMSTLMKMPQWSKEITKLKGSTPHRHIEGARACVQRIQSRRLLLPLYIWGYHHPCHGGMLPSPLTYIL